MPPSRVFGARRCGLSALVHIPPMEYEPHVAVTPHALDTEIEVTHRNGNVHKHKVTTARATVLMEGYDKQPATSARLL